jgi:hypothetical protein
MGGLEQFLLNCAPSRLSLVSPQMPTTFHRRSRVLLFSTPGHQRDVWCFQSPTRNVNELAGCAYSRTSERPLPTDLSIDATMLLQNNVRFLRCPLHQCVSETQTSDPDNGRCNLEETWWYQLSLHSTTEHPLVTRNKQESIQLVKHLSRRLWSLPWTYLLS